MNKINKRLYKSKDNNMLFGVIGGMGEYFEVDPTILRLAWVLLSAITGFLPGVLLYVIAIFIIPEEPNK